MATYDGLQFFGIDIETDQTKFHGITINANNFFNSKIQVTDQSGTAIAGASVSIVSTQTHPSNYIGDLSGTTDAEGIFIATGSSTTGTTLTITADGYNTYVGNLPSTDLSGYNSSYQITLSETGGSSKKIYTTNKGNILINPNDTVLIEL
jgi:hypothetical protein